jgi:hypothetical protein
VKRTVSPSLSRYNVPFSTKPPILKFRPTGASFATTCDGLKKKTRFF